MQTTAPLSNSVDSLHVYRVLLRLLRLVEQRTRQSSDGDPVGLPELSVLGQIERGLNAPSKIARALQLDPARVTHLTDRLVALEFVERSSVEDDRRRCRLSLTNEGVARLDKGRDEVRVVFDGILSGLTNDERAGLLLSLDGVERVLMEAAEL